jgi:hypothetical protein
VGENSFRSPLIFPLKTDRYRKKRYIYDGAPRLFARHAPINDADALRVGIKGRSFD